MTGERLTAADLLQLRTDVGPVPLNIGALLRLGPGISASTVLETLRRRTPRVPRLHQVVDLARPGHGRSRWREDPAFDADAHLSLAACPGGDDLDALLDLAADVVTGRLPRSRPLWRAVVVTGPAGEEAVAVIIVLHHVLADGLSGLALLAHLVDGTTPAPRPADHRPQPTAPTTREPVVDRVVTSVRGLRSLPSTLARLRRGRVELGSGRVRAAPRCSLNHPTGARRRLTSTSVDLDRIRTAARHRGATVNDVLLVAATGALREVLLTRGEDLAELVVSVPVSARAQADGRLGNHVGVMPVRVPLVGTPGQRLLLVADRTRAQKAGARGASSGLLGPVFALLATMRVFHWFIDRQRLVNAFLTNVPGPPRLPSFAGTLITQVVPLSINAGNVAVAFTAMSYAGKLTITVIVDPDVVPELDVLTSSLREELEMMTTRGGEEVIISGV